MSEYKVYKFLIAVTSEHLLELRLDIINKKTLKVIVLGIDDFWNIASDAVKRFVRILETEMTGFGNTFLDICMKAQVRKVFMIFWSCAFSSIPDHLEHTIINQVMLFHYIITTKRLLPLFKA